MLDLENASFFAFALLERSLFLYPDLVYLLLFIEFLDLKIHVAARMIDERSGGECLHDRAQVQSDYSVELGFPVLELFCFLLSRIYRVCPHSHLLVFHGITPDHLDRIFLTLNYFTHSFRFLSSFLGHWLFPISTLLLFFIGLVILL
jgi:hypothetical protein